MEILKESKGIFEFLFEIFSESLNLNEITGKRKIIEKFKEFFSNVVNNTEKNLYVSKLSVELGIDKEVLINELGSISKGYSRNKTISGKPEKTVIKSSKAETYDLLEIETLKFLLKYKKEVLSGEKSYCEKFYNKKFENIIYGDIFEKLKTVDFDISKIDDLTLEEEEKELITTMKLQAEIDILNEERHYKDIFIGWFLREINFMRKIIEKKDRAYITLHRLKSELKIIHNINEIEEMYKEFNLIRRSDYV